MIPILDWLLLIELLHGGPYLVIPERWWRLAMSDMLIQVVQAPSEKSRWRRACPPHTWLCLSLVIKKRKEIHCYIKCESIWEYFRYSIIHVLLLLSLFIMFFMKKHTYRSHRNLEQAIINNLQRGERTDKQISSCAFAFMHSFAHSDIAHINTIIRAGTQNDCHQRVMKDLFSNVTN